MITQGTDSPARDVTLDSKRDGAKEKVEGRTGQEGGGGRDGWGEEERMRVPARKQFFVIQRVCMRDFLILKGARAILRNMNEVDEMRRSVGACKSAKCWGL